MNKVYTKRELDAILAKSKNTIALFYATWCPYCMKFEPLFNQEVVQFGFENVVHVLLDDYDNPLWDEYDISAVPTVILFEGKQVYRRLDGRLGRGLKVDDLVMWLQGLGR